MYNGILAGHEANQKVIEFIKGIQAEIGKEKFDYPSNKPEHQMFLDIRDYAEDAVRAALDTDDKNVRDERLKPVYEDVHQHFAEQYPDMEAKIDECLYLTQKYVDVYKRQDIKQRMFERKSRGQVEAERRAMESMVFFHGGKCAMIQLPQRLFGETGVTESDLDGLAAMPREIQGVVLGITLKEKEDGKVKVSVRANPPADASVLCARLGGGGHQGAAGCSLGTISLQEAQEKMEQACGAYLEELGLL